MCLIPMNGLNEVMPQTKALKFTKRGQLEHHHTINIGKLIKSYFNQPKPLDPVGEPLFTLIPEALLDTKPIDPNV